MKLQFKNQAFQEVASAAVRDVFEWRRARRARPTEGRFGGHGGRVTLPVGATGYGPPGARPRGTAVKRDFVRTIISSLLAWTHANSELTGKGKSYNIRTATHTATQKVEINDDRKRTQCKAECGKSAHAA